jgi:hypothetical protein
MSGPTSLALDNYHEIIKAQADEIASLKECLHIADVENRRYITNLEHQFSIRDERCAELEAELEATKKKLADKDALCTRLAELVEDLEDEQGELILTRWVICLYSDPAYTDFNIGL